MNPSNPGPPPADRAARRIRGPHSALTDFLASHNIDATQIRQAADARRAAAAAEQEGSHSASGQEEHGSVMDVDEPEGDVKPKRESKETKLQSKKRKKQEEKAIAKIKASKKFQRQRKKRDSGDEFTDDDDAARALWQESLPPLPAQMENCEVCSTRFTVTPYSRTGPNGGLLCFPCAKQLLKEEGAARKQKRNTAGRQRRKLQSDLLDGIYPGAKTLVSLCVDTLVHHVDMAESFGDLPDSLMIKLAWIIAKKRMLKSNTLDLFLQPGRQELQITDGAYLSSDDYIRAFQVMPSIKNLRVRNGIQFKNKVIDHLLGSPVELECLSLHGSNLIDNERWNAYLEQKGSFLKWFKLAWTDQYFGDEQIKLLVTTCPHLERLKITHNQSLTDEGVKAIAGFTGLQQLALELYRLPGQKPSETTPLTVVLAAHASSLRRFSLSRFYHVNDEILKSLRLCTRLFKLRISYNSVMTDAAFAALFTGWINPPLTYIDFSNCAHVDSTNPRDNANNVGLCSTGFEAMMAHSGKTLRYLDINHCRHISNKSFLRVFDPNQSYPELRKMNISFCQEVNDYVVQSIFKVCPALKELIVFGNFKVKDVKVPKGKILIGMPNAMGMQVEGAEDAEEGQTAW